MSGARSAFTSQASSADAARELVEGLGGADPRVVVFFAGIAHDGAHLGRALAERFPRAEILGCSSNGEFTDRGHGKGGAAALAIGEDKIGACAAAMADVGGDLDAGIRSAADRLSSRLGHDIRDLDPARYAGIALLEGARGREERINEALGNVAPFLPFIGGSAGDDITFTGTWTFVNGSIAKDGTALFVAEMLAPFSMFKTCHFAPTERTVTVTRVDPARRAILELDGEPAAPYYARAIGTSVEELSFQNTHANPFGLMIDGEPWLRSVLRPEGDALLCACAVVAGARLHFMRATELVEDAREKIAAATSALGGSLSGALFFNCAFRMIEADLHGKTRNYHDALSTVVHAGLHTNGESYLGQITQTLTGIVF
jgi:hypothetical protein